MLCHHLTRTTVSRCGGRRPFVFTEHLLCAGPVKALRVLVQFLFLSQLEGLILCSPFYRRTHFG